MTPQGVPIPEAKHPGSERDLLQSIDSEVDPRKFQLDTLYLYLTGLHGPKAYS